MPIKLAINPSTSSTPSRHGKSELTNFHIPLILPLVPSPNVTILLEYDFNSLMYLLSPVICHEHP